MSQPVSRLKTTGLHARHRSLGARMVAFAGWHMPIKYASILEEHRAVRERVGVFDVSHMGRIQFSGAGCVPYLQRIFTCDVALLGPGQARYTLICTEEGGILDDTILYCRRSDSFLLVCNAANTAAVLEWLEQWKRPGQSVTIRDTTAATGMLALQGPQAVPHLAPLVGEDTLERLAGFRWVEAVVAGEPALVSRTGYTGEDGFEIIGTADHIVTVWDKLLESGAAPCGLGARDTLRLEAALPLHGNDINLETNPVEAGLLWTVALAKPSFLGREAIMSAKEQGTAQRLAGFEIAGRGIPRPHQTLLFGGKPVGTVTSGGYGPTLHKGIGMGYVPTGLAKPGTDIAVDVRGTIVPARTVARPFYRRQK